MKNTKSPATTNPKFNLRRETVKTLVLKTNVKAGGYNACDTFNCTLSVRASVNVKGW